MDEGHSPKARRALRTMLGAVQYRAKCFIPILAISTLMGQIVPVVGVQGGHGGTGPSDWSPLPSAVQGNRISEVFIVPVQPFHFTGGKRQKKALAQVTWSDSGKAVFASQVPQPQTGASSPMRYLFLPHLTPFPRLVARG